MRSPGGARGPPQGSGSDDGSAHPPPVVSPAGPPAWGPHSAQAHGLGRHPLPRGLSDGCTKTRRSSRAGSRDSSAARRCHRAQGEGWGGAAPLQEAVCPSAGAGLPARCGADPVSAWRGGAVRKAPSRLPLGQPRGPPASRDGPVAEQAASGHVLEAEDEMPCA